MFDAAKIQELVRLAWDEAQSIDMRHLGEDDRVLVYETIVDLIEGISPCLKTRTGRRQGVLTVKLHFANACCGHGGRFHFVRGRGRSTARSGGCRSIRRCGRGNGRLIGAGGSGSGRVRPRCKPWSATTALEHWRPAKRPRPDDCSPRRFAACLRMRLSSTARMMIEEGARTTIIPH